MVGWEINKKVKDKMICKIFEFRTTFEIVASYACFKNALWHNENQNLHLSSKRQNHRMRKNILHQTRTIINFTYLDSSELSQIKELKCFSRVMTVPKSWFYQFIEVPAWLNWFGCITVGMITTLAELIVSVETQAL